MALKSTIFKAELQIADVDRGYYRDHALTVARHPSETDERMMVRLLAFAHNAHDDLALCKGLSDADEPDLWQRDLTGAVARWIEVGQPDERRILRACGRADQVRIYIYGGSGTQQWWQQMAGRLARASNLTVIRLPVAGTKALAQRAQRNMRLQVTIQEGQLMVTAEDGAPVVIEPEFLMTAP